MLGYADVKTNVLSRDEKGFFGIPFKRIMVAAVIGAMCFTFGKAFFGSYTVIFSVIFFFFTLFMTSERGGLPRYQRIILGIRGTVILNAFDKPGGIYTQLAELMQLAVDLAEVDADEIFVMPGEAVQADLSGLVVYSSPFESGRGMVYVDDPVRGLLSRRETGTTTAVGGD